MDFQNCGRKVARAMCVLAAASLLPPTINAQVSLTIESVAADRSLWPREVSVNVAHQVPLLVNGKVSGSMQVSPGRVYPIVSIQPSGVLSMQWALR
jgi:hypothetical protein